jgi:hypothetical protein
VTSAPVGIDCATSCTASFDNGTRVVLAARPAAGWNFSGWTGACSGTTDCTLTLSADASVSARFAPAGPPPPAQHLLTVAIVGQGHVTSSPAGIDCPGTCTATLADGIRATLTASAASGWEFSGWSGACSGADCALILAADGAATATFAQVVPPPPPPAISVSIAPATANVVAGGRVAFTATVAGTTDQGVLWSVAEGQTGGSVDATGKYTAPATSGSYHIVATSHADSTRSATALVR